MNTNKILRYLSNSLKRIKQNIDEKLTKLNDKMLDDVVFMVTVTSTLSVLGCILLLCFMIWWLR